MMMKARQQIRVTAFHLITVFAVAAILLPEFVMAQNQTIRDIITTGQRIIATAIPVVLALALLSFFWGVIMYLSAAQRGSEAAIKGRNVLMWGVVVLFALVSIWGIVSIVRWTFGLGA